MAGWNTAGAGTKAGGIGVVAVVAVGVGYLLWPAPEVPVVGAEVAAVVDAVTGALPVLEPEAVAALAPEPEPAPKVVIDTWRVGPDGAGIVVGIAPNGAMMRVTVDGVVVAEGAVSGAGEFALPLTLVANPEPSLMEVQAVTAEGAAMAEPVVIALGPIAWSVIVVAGAEPETPVLPEPEPVTALLVTDAGAVVVQDAPVAPGAEVSIDAISYTAAGAVSLAGKGSAGADLQLYLDNAPIQTLTVPLGGQWLTTLKDTAPGIYTLRVDQLDASGKVTSRFETPFQRETLEALAAVSTAAEVAVVAEIAAPEAVVVAEPAPEPVAEVVQDVVAEPAAEPAAEPVAEAMVEPVAEPQEVAVVVPEVATPEPEPEPEPEVAAVSTAPETEPATPEPVAPEPSGPVTVTVQPGFTLWGIAKGQMGEGVMYVQVFDANKDKIRNPDLIYPGQVLVIPGAD